MTELNGVPIPNPSDGQTPVTPPPAPPVPPVPDAYSTPVAPPAPDAYATPAPPAYAQPAYTPPAYAPPAAADPGRTLGIVGLILAFFVSLAGIIVSAIALSRSKKAGYRNGIALTGLILSIVFFVIGLIVTILIIVGIVALGSQCAELGNGVHELSNGSTITCNF